MRRVPDDEFGALLKRYRTRANLTQEELAAHAGLSVRSISDMERGAPHIPRRETLRLQAAALSLTPDEANGLTRATTRSISQQPTR